MKLLICGVAMALFGAAAATSVAGPSRLIQANASMQRLGGWRIDLDPTLGAAARTFGAPSSCRHIALEDGSISRWNTLGIRIVAATLGRIPNGDDSCSFQKMPVSFVTVTGRRWTTSFGLKVGDSVAKLRRLYPAASFHRVSYGDQSPANSYWLVTHRTLCLGICNTLFGTMPKLVAQTRAGKVVSFVFPVGAQGE